MQDRAVYAIGKWYLETSKSGVLERIIQNMNPGQDYQMIVLVFKIDDENVQWSIDIEKVGEGDAYLKYAYRKGASNGGDITFTTKLSGAIKTKFKDTIDKKFKTILEIQFKKLKEKLNSFEYQEERGIFLAVEKCLIDNEEQIKKELSDLWEKFDKKTRQTLGLTIAIEIQGQRKYLRDFKVIQDKLLAVETEGRIEKYGKTSKSSNKVCSVTGRVEEEIYGFAFPYKFSTADKPGFVSCFFNQKNNWINYPISKEAAVYLDVGYTYIKNNLNAEFHGHSYYLVPKLLLKKKDSSNRLSETIQLLTKLVKDEKENRENKNKTELFEDYIQHEIAKESNYFNLDLIFFKEEARSKAIKISLTIEDVFPSRFRTIFVDVPQKVNKNSLYKDVFKKGNETKDLTFNFGIVKEFFEDNFLEITNHIFLGYPISKTTFYNSVMKVIRDKYNQKLKGASVSLRQTIIKAHLLMNYLQELNILEYNQNFKFMETQNENKQVQKFDVEKLKKFIEENKNFLDSDEKIGIFAVGILVRMVFRHQQRHLESTPFEKKLRGFNLNPELLKSIYVEAIEKIRQYTSYNAYGNLRELISKYFVLNSNNLSKLSNNEISFYFVAGLELGNDFITEQNNE